LNFLPGLKGKFHRNNCLEKLPGYSYLAQMGDALPKKSHSPQSISKFAFISYVSMGYALSAPIAR
jgi:hypothetical protein